MSIRVTCGACGAPYNVADAMAGKKLRCKQCGGVFVVPSGADAEDPLPPEPDLTAAAEPEPPPPRPQPPRRPKVLPPVSRMPGEKGEEPDDDDDAEAAPYTPPTLSANPAFQFGAADWIDSAAPYLITLALLTWLLMQSLRPEESAQAWFGYFRAAIYIVGYVAIVFPFSLLGVHQAGRKARFGMPPSHLGKVFSVFLIPFALGVIFSLSGGRAIHFVLGFAVGLGPALAGFWFHYRLLPRQMTPAFATALMFHFLGVLTAVLLGVGINVIVQASLNSSRPDPPYTSSPLGPAFAWQPTPPPLKPGGRPLGVPLVDSTTQNSSTQSTTEPTTQPATQPLATTQPRTPTTEPVVVATTQALPATNPATTATTLPTTPHTQPSSPLVASLSTDLPTGDFDSISFAPIAPTAMLLVKSRGPIADTLEVWSTQPLEKKATLAPQHPRDAKSEYFLGPKAAIVARIIDFPKKAIEIRTAADDKVIKTVDLDTRYGTPQIIGFAAANQLAVLCDNSGTFTVEMLDVLTGLRTRGITLPGFEKARGNLAISPDGRYLAAAIKTDGPAIQVTEIGNPRAAASRAYRVTALGPDKQSVSFSAIAFSPDSSRFAAFYEEAGNWLLIAFKLGDPKQLSAYTIFSDRPNLAPADYLGPALDWLPDGVAWLIYGQTVLLYGPAAVESDRVLGTLGIATLEGHHLLDRDTIALIVPAPDGGKRQLAFLKLNQERLTATESAKGPAKSKP